MSTSSFPSFPISNITFPSTPLIHSALAYTREHTTPTTVNHCLRSSAFALLISRKIPTLQAIDAETLILSTIMHDLGWATTKSLLSTDKRFEVDGANLAKAFISSHSSSSPFTQERLNTIWTAIALHATVSISIEHPVPEIQATTYGISADFAGPNFPGGLITVDEYKEVVAAFPRLGFNSAGLREIMCGLCREKPETTYDNFVGGFGVRFLGDEYKAGLERSSIVDRLMGGLDAVAVFD